VAIGVARAGAEFMRAVVVDAFVDIELAAMLFETDSFKAVRAKEARALAR